MKRFLSLVVLFVLCFFACASVHGEDDPSQHVILTMYCIGDEGGPYAQAHLDLVNRLLTERINAEIKPVMVSWDDYATKLPMIWASGEEYDLTYISDWSGYFTEGVKGPFMDISEMLPRYAPHTWMLMQERSIAESVQIKGKIYMVPAFIKDYTTYFLEYREDLRKKYNCPEIVDDNTLGVFLQTIRDQEPVLQSFGINGRDSQAFWNFLNENDWSRPIEKQSGFLVYDLLEPTRVFNVADTPEYEAFVRKMRDYYLNGFFPQDVLLETDSPKDLFTAGKSATAYVNFAEAKKNHAEIQANHPDWEIGYYSSDYQSGHVELMAPSANGIAIGAYSRHPERALQFIELMYTDEEVYRALWNGIEHVNYEIDRENRTIRLPEGANPAELKLKNLGMQFGLDEWNWPSPDDSPILNDFKKQFEQCAILPGLSSFTMDLNEISGLLHGLNSVYTEYKLPLEKGTIDPELGLQQLRERLNAAGIQKIVDEVNRQITEFRRP